LGNADTGDRMTLRGYFQAPIEVAGIQEAADLDQIPGSGPAIVVVPDLGTTTILIDIVDPSNDDYGPGTYTYPTDGVFSGGSFDALNFQVGFDDENVVFRFLIRGPINNSWGSPNGLSIQSFDVYIDTDGDGIGGVAMLPGRNLALQEGATWDYAVAVEGWTSGIFIPGEEGPQRIAEASEFLVLTDPGQRKVTIRIPKTILGDNPETWRYAAVVLGQEGFPSGGVMRVRDVLPDAEQWRIGGGPADTTNHTRVLDLIWAIPGEQEEWLSDYVPVNAQQSDLTAADLARVPMFGIE
jgi:carbohydrate-binding DOMON domain-containing protein